MFSFKTKADTGASVAIIAALVIMVATIAYSLLIPAPSTEGVANGPQRSIREIEDQIKQGDEQLTEKTTYVQSKIWDVPLDDIGPKALQSVTKFAQEAKIKLVAFRPQKPTDVNGLTQLPFLISLEGGYPGVMQFLRKLEAGNVKLAINSAQIASSDANSDTVTATVGAVVYTIPPSVLKTASNPTTEKVHAEKTN